MLGKLRPTRGTRRGGTAVAEVGARPGSVPGGKPCKEIGEMKQMRLATVAVLGVLASACNGTVERPDIALEGVELGSLGLAGGTLIAHIQVHNPNSFTLRAEDLHYQLFLRKNAA